MPKAKTVALVVKAIDLKAGDVTEMGTVTMTDHKVYRELRETNPNVCLNVVIGGQYYSYQYPESLELVIERSACEYHRPVGCRNCQ